MRQLFTKAKMNYISQVSKYSDAEIDLLIENWIEELANYKLQDLALALKKHFRKSEFFPTIKNFIEYIEGNQEQNVKIKLIDAEEKFKEIIKSGRSIKCDDWAIHNTIKKMGGLDEIRQSKLDKIEWVIKEFLEKYEAEIQRKNVGLDIPPILYTRRDKQQIENRLQILPPTMIGDEREWEKWTNRIKYLNSIENDVKKLDNTKSAK